MPNKLTITYSSWSSYMNCPTRYYWRYERGLVLTESKLAPTIGTLTHEGLASLLTGKGIRAAVRAIKQWAASEGNSDVVVDAALIAEFLIHRYREFYGSKAPPKFSAEKGFEIDMGDGVMFCGKMDGLQTSKKDGDWLWEHKTTQRPDDYLSKLPLDRQVTAYLFACAVIKSRGGKGILAREPKGVIYNVVKTPSKYIRAGESMPEYLIRCKADYLATPSVFFVRQKCFRGDTDFDRFVEDLLDTAALIRRRQQDNYWPQNTGQCWIGRRTCPYVGLCCHDDAATMLRYRTKKPFSELDRRPVKVKRNKR